MANVHTSDGRSFEIPEKLIIEGSIAGSTNVADSGTEHAPSSPTVFQTQEDVENAALGWGIAGCGFIAVEAALVSVAGGAFIAGSRLGESHPKLATVAHAIGITATVAAVALGVGGGWIMAKTGSVIGREIDTHKATN